MDQEKRVHASSPTRGLFWAQVCLAAREREVGGEKVGGDASINGSARGKNRTTSRKPLYSRGKPVLGDRRGNETGVRIWNVIHHGRVFVNQSRREKGKTRERQRITIKASKERKKKDACFPMHVARGDREWERSPNTKRSSQRGGPLQGLVDSFSSKEPQPTGGETQKKKRGGGPELPLRLLRRNPEENPHQFLLGGKGFKGKFISIQKPPSRIGATSQASGAGAEMQRFVLSDN